MVSVLVLASCGPRGGTDVGNGATVTFDLRGFEEKPKDPEDAQQNSLVLTSGTRVDELWVVVDRFKLSAKGKCAKDDVPENDEFDAKGPFVAEILSTGVLGSLPMASVPEGEYCRFEMRLHELSEAEAPASAPSDLVGFAVLMRGQRADGTPFTVRTKQPVQFRLDATESTFSVSDGRPFLLGFELSRLVQSLDLATVEGDEILVDPMNDPERLKDFDEALRHAPRLFEDLDGDGDLSEQETNSALAEGQSDDD